MCSSKRNILLIIAVILHRVYALDNYYNYITLYSYLKKNEITYILSKTY